MNSGTKVLMVPTPEFSHSSRDHDPVTIGLHATSPCTFTLHSLAHLLSWILRRCRRIPIQAQLRHLRNIPITFCTLEIIPRLLVLRHRVAPDTSVSVPTNMQWMYAATRG